MDINALFDDDNLKTRLNRETAKINWEELQRFYAAGSVVVVKPGLDLIVVAEHFTTDNTTVVAQLLEQGNVYRPDDQQAQLWYQQQVSLWAVVIAPWVLVQEIKQA